MNDLATFGRALQKLISAPILKRGFCEAELVLSKELGKTDNKIVATKAQRVYEFQHSSAPRGIRRDAVEAWALEQGWELVNLNLSYTSGYSSPLGFDHPQEHSIFTFREVGR